jgi:hypothetical protein
VTIHGAHNGIFENNAMLVLSAKRQCGIRSFTFGLSCSPLNLTPKPHFLFCLRVLNQLLDCVKWSPERVGSNLNPRQIPRVYEHILNLLVLTRIPAKEFEVSQHSNKKLEVFVKLWESESRGMWMGVCAYMKEEMENKLLRRWIC